ncbi:MAG: hypothetical protein JSW65_08485, partial [Candidatus Bipolaricaulota bacterium]
MTTKVSTLYLVAAEVDRLSVGLDRAAGFLFADDRAASPVSAGHPDLFLLVPAPKKTSIGIDQVRDVVRSMHFAADNADRRVCLSPHAERLTPQAANALLKAIEEPPGNALFVLLASHASALPPTIVSRLRIERVHSTPEAPEERPWDESLSSMDDAQLVAQACDDPTPPSRRRAVGAVLTRVASGAGRYAIGITGAIASRGRDAVTQFVEDAQRVLAEELR